MSYLVDKHPIAYRNPREKSISYPHDILFKIIFYGFAYLILVSSQANSEKNHPPPKKKNRTKISVYSSDYVGVKLSSVSSVPDEYVLRLLRNGEKG